MTPHFAATLAAFLGMVVAAGMWAATDAELDALLKGKTKLEADIRHFKAQAYKCQDYVLEEVHNAHMETITLAMRMQAELDACRKP